MAKGKDLHREIIKLFNIGQPAGVIAHQLHLSKIYVEKVIEEEMYKSPNLLIHSPKHKWENPFHSTDTIERKLREMF